MKQILFRALAALVLLFASATATTALAVGTADINSTAVLVVDDDPGFANTDIEITQDPEIENDIDIRESKGSGILEGLGFLALGLLILWSFGHMIYIYFFKERPLPQLSLGNGNDDDNDESMAILHSFLDEMPNSITEFTDENGEPSYIFTTHEQMENARVKLTQVYNLNPSDPEAVDIANDLIRMYNEMQQRTFCGSKPLLIMLGVVSAIACFCGGAAFLYYSIPAGFMYWLSTMKPNFKIAEMELNGEEMGSGCMNTILGAAFGAVAAAKTYTVVTKWSDGSTTRDTDNSETWGSLIWLVIVCAVLCAIITVVSLINYLRNYIIFK